MVWGGGVPCSQEGEEEDEYGEDDAEEGGGERWRARRVGPASGVLGPACSSASPPHLPPEPLRHPHPPSPHPHSAAAPESGEGQEEEDEYE